MSARCSICGSYALNVARESGLCDLHFYKVQRDELLDALRQMLVAYQGKRQGVWGESTKPVIDARAAIAKATGAAA